MKSEKMQSSNILLTREQHEGLGKIAQKTKILKAVLIREGVDMVIKKYGKK